MEISWALIINHPNYLNLLNLLNHSISQSINRGLGEDINQSSLESKVMLVVYLQSHGAVELKVLWLQRSPCVRSWVVLSLFHVYWLNEYV